MNDIFTHFLQGFTFLTIVYLFMYLNKIVSDLYAERKGYKTNYAIEEDSNLAVSLRRSGLYLGIAIAMMGIIIGPSAGFYNDVMGTIFYGAVISALFFVARQVNDMFLSLIHI